MAKATKNVVKTITCSSLDERLVKVEEFIESQREWNKQVRDALFAPKTTLQEKKIVKETKAPKTTTKVTTKKKETSDNTNVLKEKLTTLVNDNMNLETIYKIVNYCFKKLRNNTKKIESYIQYNKDNKRANVNKIVNFYLKENLAQYMSK